jgi:hypothetical protein
LNSRRNLHHLAVDLATKSARGELDPEIVAVQLRALEIALKSFDVAESKENFALEVQAEFDPLERQKQIYQKMESGEIALEVGLKLIKALKQLTDVEHPQKMQLSGALEIELNQVQSEKVMEISSALQNQLRLLGDQIEHLKAELAYFIHVDGEDKKWRVEDEEKWKKRFHAGVIVTSANKSSVKKPTVQ